MFLALCNCPPDVGPAVARALVEGRYAACVNIIPGVRSLYEWEGEICDDAEVTLLIKTTRAKMAALRAKIVEIHPYSVPEILSIPVATDASHAPYVDWVRQMTT